MTQKRSPVVFLTVLVLPRFLRYNDRTAPNTATKATIEAAIMNGDGKGDGFTVGVGCDCCVPCWGVSCGDCDEFGVGLGVRLGAGFAGELAVSVSSGTVMVPEIALTDEGKATQDVITKTKTSSRVAISLIFSPFFTWLISRIKDFLSTFLD
ncbi:MAG: hypothetical protein ABSB10_11260 [Candidatus Bathyarchaeia archaeon]|jgi:hypothetical protein